MKELTISDLEEMLKKTQIKETMQLTGKFSIYLDETEPILTYHGKIILKPEGGSKDKCKAILDQTTVKFELREPARVESDDSTTYGIKKYSTQSLIIPVKITNKAYISINELSDITY